MFNLHSRLNRKSLGRKAVKAHYSKLNALKKTRLLPATWMIVFSLKEADSKRLVLELYCPAMLCLYQSNLTHQMRKVGPMRLDNLTQHLD